MKELKMLDNLVLDDFYRRPRLLSDSHFQGDNRGKSSKNIIKNELDLEGRNKMYKKVKNDKIIRCSICRRILGTGKIKIDIVCIFCYKRKGGNLLGSKGFVPAFTSTPSEYPSPSVSANLGSVPCWNSS